MSERDDFIDWLHEKFLIKNNQHLRGAVDRGAQHFNVERRSSALHNAFNKKQPREPQLVILCYKDKNFTAILLPTREERQIVKELIPQDGLLFFNVFPIGGGRVNVEADYSGDAQAPFCHILAVIADVHEEAANKIVNYLKSVSPTDEPVQSEKLQDSRKRGEPGRRHSPDDLWAWEQVNTHKRPMNDVRLEWLRRDGVIARKLEDAVRQFNRITKPGWGQKTK